jgi:hypothetical protein
MDNWKERGAGMPGATQAVYDGEEVTIQAGITLLFELLPGLKRMTNR